MSYTMNRIASLFVLLAVISFACADFASAEVVRTVTLSGNLADGAGDGLMFGLVMDPVINGAGDTAFVSYLSDGNKSVWREDNRSLDMVAMQGAAAPGLSGDGVFSSFGFLPPRLNDLGQIAFSASVSGTGIDTANDKGFWSSASGSLSLVAREGDAAVGAGEGMLFSSFPVDTIFSQSGRMAFRAKLSGDSVTSMTDNGIWRQDSNGVLEMAVIEGQEAPGTSAGIVFSALSGPLMNDLGDVAFSGGLTGSGVTGANSSGLWQKIGSQTQLLARKGSQAVGTESGTTYSAASAQGINNRGDVLFSAILAGNATAGNDTGLWMATQNGLAMVVREGDAAPGLSAGTLFGGFNVNSGAVVNAGGDLSFLVGLTGTSVDATNDAGLWSTVGGDMRLVAREGDQAPGTEAGTSFASIGNFVLNANGQLAMRATLSGVGIDDSNDMGIWAQDPSGVLQLIMREGQLLTLAAGDERITAGTSGLGFAGFSGNEDSQISGFSDNGELAFSAMFTDGSSGIFVSNLVVVPEPSTWILALLGGLFATAVAMRRRQVK